MKARYIKPETIILTIQLNSILMVSEPETEVIISDSSEDEVEATESLGRHGENNSVWDNIW